MEKTIKEWYSELPDGYRELALKHLSPKNESQIAPSMEQAIKDGFFWSGKPSFAFWKNVTLHYIKGYSLPPLPDAEPKLDVELLKIKVEKLEKLSDNHRKQKDYWKKEAKEAELRAQTAEEAVRQMNQVREQAQGRRNTTILKPINYELEYRELSDKYAELSATTKKITALIVILCIVFVGIILFR